MGEASESEPKGIRTDYGHAIIFFTVIIIIMLGLGGGFLFSGERQFLFSRNTVCEVISANSSKNADWWIVDVSEQGKGTRPNATFLRRTHGNTSGLVDKCRSFISCGSTVTL